MEDTGQPPKRGMLLLHGNFAHAHWWTPIAPFWAEDFDVVAMSMSGHGQSGWRDEYSFSQWAQEVMEVGRDAGFSDKRGCLLVAHSMGVAVAMVAEKLFNRDPGRWASVCFLSSNDSSVSRACVPDPCMVAYRRNHFFFRC